MRFLLPLTLSVIFVSAGVRAKAQEPAPAQQTQSAVKPTRIRIGGNVALSRLINKVQPVYPPLARQTRISGTVRLHAIVSKEGTISQLDVVSGHPLLQQAALDAVRQWRYEPTLLDGEPVEVDTTIDVVFALAEDSIAQRKPADAAVDPQLRANILHLFDVIHFKENAAKGGREVFESLRPALMASLPNTSSRGRITDAYIDKLLALLQSDSYTDRVISIYAKYFSAEDVNGLLQFYQTPAGQHFNVVMPQLLGDLNQIGQQLATESLPGIIQQLCRDFPELQEDPRFCKEPDQRQKSMLLDAPRTIPTVSGQPSAAGYPGLVSEIP